MRKISPGHACIIVFMYLTREQPLLVLRLLVAWQCETKSSLLLTLVRKRLRLFLGITPTISVCSWRACGATPVAFGPDSRTLRPDRLTSLVLALLCVMDGTPARLNWRFFSYQSCCLDLRFVPCPHARLSRYACFSGSATHCPRFERCATDGAFFPKQLAWSPLL
jgi:hypothetical protein